MNDKKLNLAKVKDIIENKMPVNKLFGLEVVEIEVGYVKLHVPFKEEFIGDALQKLWHGGILAGIADTAGGIAAATTTYFPHDKINTIDIRIDFLKGATNKDIYVVADVIKVGKRIINADIKVFHEDGDLITVARASYSVLRK
ncbi:PaaI family thioesterase [bacterium]|nr:PaaI family thioesterase [bacterium]